MFSIELQDWRRTLSRVALMFLASRCFSYAAIILSVFMRANRRGDGASTDSLDTLLG